MRLRPSKSDPELLETRIALLVEDEWLIRMELAEALTNAGWVVAEAASGEDALALIAKSDEFALLVTDIRLQGVFTGWDVAEVFRQRCPQCPVIYASGNAALTERQVAFSAFLAKPVLIDQLLSHVDRIRRASLGDNPTLDESA